MKNITLKGMNTMPSEHEARDGELSLAINLVAHAGELHPQQVNEMFPPVPPFETGDSPVPFDGEGQHVNAVAYIDDLMVTAYDDHLLYSLYDEDGEQWHHLRQQDLRYTMTIDQRAQRRVTLTIPVDSTLQRCLQEPDKAVSGQKTLLRQLFTEWENDDVATGATIALAHAEQALDKEMARSGRQEHKHISLVIAAMRLFDGSHILMSNPMALIPADGEPTLEVITDGDEKRLRTTACLHSHTVTVNLANDVDMMMVGRLVQGIDIYQSEPLTRLDLRGAATIITDESGMATRLSFGWVNGNVVAARLARATFRHVLHIATADFGTTMLIPRESNGEVLDISDMHRHDFGARVMRTIDGRLCAAQISTLQASPFSIATSYVFRNLDTTERGSADERMMECLCGERPDIDEHEEGLTAEVVNVVHLRNGATATTRAFHDHVRYPLPGIIAYPDSTAFLMELHLCFRDSEGEHHYRRDLSLRQVGSTGMAIGLWSGSSGGHAASRPVVHSVVLQQARSMRYDDDAARWRAVADLWTRESADEWEAAMAMAQQTPTPTTDSNMLYTSLEGTPLVFPPTGRIAVGDGTITALTPRVRRYGGIQFGQYPLYVFCTDGVWALQRGDGTSWRGKYQVSRYACTMAQPAETADQVVYLSDDGLIQLDGGKATRISGALDGMLFDTNALPYFNMMMHTLFGERFAPLPSGWLTWSDRSTLVCNRRQRQVTVVDPSQTLHATVDLDSGCWGLMEMGIDPVGGTIPVVALTREISTPEHSLQRWRRVEVCGLFRQRHDTNGTLLCILLWGSNDQYHWHLLGSSRCPILLKPVGSPWRWYRVAIAGWMAHDERISHLKIED